MVGDERAMLDLVEVYHRELAALVRAARAPDDRDRTTALALAFFSESLSPFAMAQRGFRDAIARLRDLHHLLREPHEATDFIVSVLESSTEYAIIGKDLDGTIILWNEGARRIYGYEAAEVVGKAGSAMLYTPEDVALGKPREIMDRALHDGKWEGMVNRVRKSGDRFVARVVITPRRDAAGTPIGFLLMSKDISDEIRLTEELQRKNEELEEQYRHVEEANRLKSEFLANMSHELRTPLNAIIGFTELMYDGKVGPISDLHKEYLGDVLTSSRHLLRLINDILDLAKVEAGKIEFRPEEVDIAQLVDEVRDILRTLAAAKLLHIAVEVDPALTTVLADPSRLKQILYNYLSNAIKFTPEHGRVTIRVAAEDGDDFRLEVEDTGIGIRPQDMERLFVEFQQLDAGASKKYQGTGLGLALTKRIAEAQGGRVGVRSTPGEGSVFFAVLPRVAAPARTDAGLGDRLQGSRDTARRRILVVEDDQWSRSHS